MKHWYVGVMIVLVSFGSCRGAAEGAPLVEVETQLRDSMITAINSPGNTLIGNLVGESDEGINERDENGDTLLHHAARLLKPFKIQHLMFDYENRGYLPNLSAQNNQGETVFHTILQAHDDESPKTKILSTLIEQAQQRSTEQSLALPESKGNTPLHLAAGMGSDYFARLFFKLNEGHDISGEPRKIWGNYWLPNNAGDTPLSLAIKKGNKENAELLLAHGAEFTQEDKAAGEALDLNFSGEPINPVIVYWRSLPFEQRWFDTQSKRISQHKKVRRSPGLKDPALPASKSPSRLGRRSLLFLAAAALATGGGWLGRKYNVLSRLKAWWAGRKDGEPVEEEFDDEFDDESLLPE